MCPCGELGGYTALIMANKNIALEVAAFLDSDEAKALGGLKPAELRKIAELFIELCYENLGSKPALMDGGDLHGVLGHLMPGRLKRNDPLAKHVPGVLRAFFGHLEKDQVVPQIYEIRQAIESTTDEFLETVRTGKNVHHQHKKQAPVVHQADKAGRNDPCPCGSGKKFKKCHGKAG